jgi:CheY-like chemotaxis protein
MMNDILKDKEGSDQVLPFPGIKALICDDDELNQKIMGRLLARFGITSDAVGNGREGLEAVGRLLYDIVFIDLNMPVLDGRQMALALRASDDPRVAGTPLVAVTGAAHYFQERPLAETGFDDYIVKPITPQLVLQALKRTLTPAT